MPSHCGRKKAAAHRTCRSAIDTQPAIVLVSPLQEIRRHVILGLLCDLSPLWPTLQLGPRQIAERLLGRANETLRSEAVQLERRLSRAGLLHANDPFEIIGEAEVPWIIRLLIEEGESVLAAYPELIFSVVRLPRPLTKRWPNGSKMVAGVAFVLLLFC
jgi:hypothetical protein